MVARWGCCECLRFRLELRSSFFFFFFFLTTRTDFFFFKKKGWWVIRQRGEIIAGLGRSRDAAVMRPALETRRINEQVA